MRYTNFNYTNFFDEIGKSKLNEIRKDGTIA